MSLSTIALHLSQLCVNCDARLSALESVFCAKCCGEDFADLAQSLAEDAAEDARHGL